MADFCKQCALKTFGRDTRDLAGLCDAGEFVHVLCEGCDYTAVNSEGECLGGGFCDTHGTKQAESR